MKKTLYILFPILVSIFFSACSKSPGKTSAKLKLSLSGIVNLANGVGTGGAMLFGRSTTGEMFGKSIVGTEENLDIPNGDWTFYALMWDTATTGNMMNDKVHCAKSVAKLTGADVVVNFNLTNANCTDPEFSGGRHYFDGTNNRFSKIYLEECDEINATTPWYCGVDNQGSAMSYRFKFQNYKRGPGTPFLFGLDALYSSCVTSSTGTFGLFNQGLPLNFPTGNGNTPFVGSVEMFLGSSSCNSNDSKGVHTVFFSGGLASQADGPNTKMLTSTQSCNNSIPSVALGSTDYDKKMLCQSYIGSMSTLCSIPSVTAQFIPSAALCGAPLATSPLAIKHMIAIPKFTLCNRYLNVSAVIGNHPFAGGNGSPERPFKICTEWQINQIGEVGSATSFRTAHFKLMNDLDMNKADFGPYAKPVCATTSPSKVSDDHHNFNPIGQLFDGSCNIHFTSGNGFEGVFIGNNKTLKNARVQAKTVYNVGLFTKLHTTGVIRNLNVINLEVEGLNQVGGIVGEVAPGGARIQNVKVTNVDVEGSSTGSDVGAIVGHLGAGAPLSEVNNVFVKDAEVRGNTHVGGIVGNLDGKVFQVSFRGEIDHHSDGDKIGGIAGFTSVTAKIEQAVSEGVLNSSSIYIGGIAGYSNAEITKSYSTMNIFSKATDSIPYVGGIVGKGDSGFLSDVYFDGTIIHDGIGGPQINGIKADGAATTSYCHTSHSLFGACSSVTPSALRDGNSATVSFSTGVGAPWVYMSGSLPRLAFEQRPCSLASNQISLSVQFTTLGRGANALNPLVVCNAGQLSDLDDSSAGKFYRLAEDINLKTWTSKNDFISSFAGTLDGNNQILYGLEMSLGAGDGAEDLGIFRANSGTIKNVNLNRNYLATNFEDITSGLLVARNTGTIEHIEAYGNQLEGHSDVGTIVGINFGNVNLVNVNEGSVKGYVYAGGVVGTNNSTGVVKRASVRTRILQQSTPSSSMGFGGVAGLNHGTIDQAQYSGEMRMDYATTNGGGLLAAGGIVGANHGAVSNVYTDSSARISVKSIKSVGGLIGENGATGTLSKSIAVGKVLFENSSTVATAAQTFHPLIGYNQNVSGVNLSYWLENRIGSKMGQSSSNTFSGTTVNISDSGAANWANPSFTALNPNLMGRTWGNGNDLEILYPITMASIDSFNFTPVWPTNTQIEFIRSYTIAADPAELNALALKDIDNYCSPGDFYGPIGYEACNANGFNIVYRDQAVSANNRGYDRLINYFVAQMSDAPIPVDAPIWEHDDDEDYPRLVQLLDH